MSITTIKKLAATIHLKKNKFLIPHALFSSSIAKEPLILKSVKNGVVTFTMNNPKRLNAWTKPMLTQMINGFKEAASDPQIKVCCILFLFEIHYS